MTHPFHPLSGQVLEVADRRRFEADGERLCLEVTPGRLEWIPLDRVPHLPIPETDREIIGPLIQEHRGGFFMVHIDCSQQPMTWTIHESIKAPIAATSNK